MEEWRTRSSTQPNPLPNQATSARTLHLSIAVGWRQVCESQPYRAVCSTEGKTVWLFFAFGKEREVPDDCLMELLGPNVKIFRMLMCTCTGFQFPQHFMLLQFSFQILCKSV